MFGLKKIFREPYEPADMRICGVEAGSSLLSGSVMQMNSWNIVSTGQPVDRADLGNYSTDDKTTFVDFSDANTWTCTFE